mmetsp:Transcript_30029/g.33537  ORF Transcript_30029/g.33537 Transcript_30029/m.33537 type:complete len:167 (-) Transcript_30029:1517-2017(-)
MMNVKVNLHAARNLRMPAACYAVMQVGDQKKRSKSSKKSDSPRWIPEQKVILDFCNHLILTINLWGSHKKFLGHVKIDMASVKLNTAPVWIKLQNHPSKSSIFITGDICLSFQTPNTSMTLRYVKRVDSRPTGIGQASKHLREKKTFQFIFFFIRSPVDHYLFYAY